MTRRILYIAAATSVLWALPATDWSSIFLISYLAIGAFFAVISIRLLRGPGGLIRS